MKKLICAAVVAGSMFVMAEEAAKAEVKAPVAAAAVKAAPKRPQITEEQRAKMREQREKFMAERKAKMEAQMLEVVKKYVPEEEKAKALIKELQDMLMAGRRNMMMRRPMPPAAKPAEAKEGGSDEIRFSGYGIRACRLCLACGAGDAHDRASRGGARLPVELYAGQADAGGPRGVAVGELGCLRT